MKTIDGHPYLSLDAPDDPDTIEAVVDVFPSVCNPLVVLNLHEAGHNGGEMRKLTPKQAREVAKALMKAADIVEARARG